MKKFFSMRNSIGLLLIMTLFLGGCSLPVELPGFQKVPELSSEYYVGATYGGASYGTIYDMISADVIVTTDKRVLIFMPESMDDYEVGKDVQVGELTLTDEQYNNIVKTIDRNKLYRLNPRPDDSVCDGYSIYLMLYNPDGSICKNCGSYMPQNKKFIAMYEAFYENVPLDDIEQIYSEQKEKLSMGD